MQGTIFRSVTTTDVDGKFVLDHVIPAEKVVVWAYKYDDYYDDVMEPFSFKRPNVKLPVVEVKAGETTTGVKIQFPEKGGKLHLYVRDASTKKLVHGVFSAWCRKGVPSKKYSVQGSGPSDDERLVSPAVEVSIQIEADDGLHKKWISTVQDLLQIADSKWR